jgi:hypothetical protein
MKKLKMLLLTCGAILTASLQAQSIGGMAQAGIYSAKYTNPNGQNEDVTGKGHLLVGATYEIKLDNKGQLRIPLVLNYAQFGTEQTILENQFMSQKATTINIGAGGKYFFSDDGYSLRPFAAALLSYEALVNSTYSYEGNQMGNLDWRSNAFLTLQTGIGIETGLNLRLDIYAAYNLGLLNRINKEEYGTYKDQMLGLGINFIFN